jgi:hypothetical protein
MAEPADVERDQKLLAWPRRLEAAYEELVRTYGGRLLRWPAASCRSRRARRRADVFLSAFRIDRLVRGQFAARPTGSS